jgi:ketosteroid isomerase-like protein
VHPAGGVVIGAPSDLPPQAQVALGFHRTLEAKDLDAFEALWTPDAVHEIPYPGTLAPPSFTGREVIADDYRAMMANRKDLQFTIHNVIVDASGGQVVVEFSGRSVIGETGHLYEQDYIGVFTIEGSQISRLRLYNDPQRAAAALASIR